MRTGMIQAFAALLLASQAHAGAATDDATRLLAQVHRQYPSLAYVEHYRQAYPGEVQGVTPFWRQPPGAPDLHDPSDLTRALVELEDQHVALTGPKAGKTETLGVLFRTASDGSLAVWHVFDPALRRGPGANRLHAGDSVTAIDGMPARAWLQRAAALTFGGQRRGRYAEAATELGLATAVAHRVAELGQEVTLHLEHAQGTVETVRLRYRPVDGALADALAAAVNQPDLPEDFRAAGLRVANIRLGAFAPQYDPVFQAAADRAGGDDEHAMLAGYCAVVRHFIRQVDEASRQADVVVLDLRGNLGGFDREARLLADALAPHALPATLDLFATPHAGTVRLARETTDPSCGHISGKAPLVVWTDAATRSAGEFEAAWLWSAGARVIGERTVGAGGGFEFDGKPAPPLPGSGYSVRLSGNFSVFDPSGRLGEGATDEQALVATLARDAFAPSRTRPFAIQSVGLRPDLSLATTAADLRDGGRHALAAALARLQAQGRLPVTANRRPRT